MTFSNSFACSVRHPWFLPVVRTGRRLLRPLAQDVYLQRLQLEGKVRKRTTGRNRSSSQRSHLRVLAHSRGFPPAVNGGAEISLLTVLEHLAQRSHEVRVLSGRENRFGAVNGVNVLEDCGDRQARMMYQWCDVVLTQREWARRSSALAMRTGRPFVYFVHSVRDFPPLGTPSMTVFSSNWMRTESSWGAPSTVLHPPVFASHYRTTPGKCITLINLTEQKGASVFYALATRLPNHEFLGVMGSWGKQIVPHPLPRNVEVMQNTDDMRKVYGKTQILLMPSRIETYGRVGLEAAASGIPTIAHPCPGLQEALGESGLFADRDAIDKWVGHIRRLGDPVEYAAQSKLAFKRSCETDAHGELAEFERLLMKLAGLA